MNLTPLSDDLNIIAKLDDEPNDVGGMTPSELKSRFDLAGNIIKAYLNGSLLPMLQAVADTAANIEGIEGVLHTLVNDDTRLVTGKAVAEAMESHGYGDMMKATYDTDNDGKVDTAELADKAVKLRTARTIALSGGATGSTSFDGSGNATIPVTALDPSVLNAPVPISRGGTGAATAAAGLYAMIQALALTDTAVQSTDRIPYAKGASGTASYLTLSNLLVELGKLGAYRTGGTDVAVADGGTGASTAAEARANLGAAAANHTHPASDTINLVYPVGSIYISANSTNPGTLFGTGTWERVKDRFLLAAGDDYTAGDTGGEAEHTLTVAEMPSHRHTTNSYAHYYTDSGSYSINSSGGRTGIDQLTTTYAGGGEAHNNMPPYLAVYVWKRIA